MDTDGENDEKRPSGRIRPAERTLSLENLASATNSKMDGMRNRNSKDKSYKNVFKGSVLVSTLLDHDTTRFTDREGAVRFAQKLLDAHHIESIVGSHHFEDSVHLYRWKDETVVKDAKKMVSTVASHIPRKKLIELVDLHQGEGGSDAFGMRDVKSKLFDKSGGSTPSKDGTARRVRSRRRQTLDAAQIADSSAALFNQQENETNLLRSASMSSEGISTADGQVSRSRKRSPSGESDIISSTTNHSGDGAPPVPRRPASNSIIDSLQESRFKSGNKTGGDGEHSPVKLTRPKQLNATESHKLSNIYDSESGRDRIGTVSPASGEGRTRRKRSTESARSGSPERSQESDCSRTKSPESRKSDRTRRRSEERQRKRDLQLSLSPESSRSQSPTSATHQNSDPKAINTSTSQTASSDTKTRTRTRSRRRESQEMNIHSNEAENNLSPKPSRTGSPETKEKRRVRSPEQVETNAVPEIEVTPAEVSDNKESGQISRVATSGGTRAERRRPPGDSDLPLSDDQKRAESTDDELLDAEGDTCRYDGIEMPALDLDNVDNLDFNVMRSQYAASHDDDNLSGVTTTSLEKLAEQSHSYSDNEKQLLEQIKKMKQDHDQAVTMYERQLKEMMDKMNDLKSLAEIIEKQKSEGVSSIPTSTLTSAIQTSSLSSLSNFASYNSHNPAAPPPPVPPPPPLPTMAQRVVQPNKDAIKPRVKMRPLFWNRIILDEKAKDPDCPIFWETATEPNFDVDEFERLFGKKNENESAKVKSLHDAMSTIKGRGRKQTAKLLDENRSRAVGIKLRSMHCQMADIERALYNMDFSQIDLDSMYNLYEVRGTKDELDQITTHLLSNEDVPLDQPEQFLKELSELSHFPERMECLMLRKRFNETLFNIDQQLSLVTKVCDETYQSEPLRTILESVLAFGNYMNGGTQRGQADGFDLSILPKLKDVKSMDNNLNLLLYIVRVYMREHEEDAGQNKAVFQLPDPVNIAQAAQVSFVDLDSDLNRLQHQLNTHCKKAELVYLDTDTSLLQPFKDQMDDFFESADEMLKRQVDNLQSTKVKFHNLLRHLAVKDVTEQVTPEAFYGLWHQFIVDYRHYWSVEQKRVAKEMFEKVEQKRKDRIRIAKRRKSVVDSAEGKANLKHKFNQHRRRSEILPSTTVKMLRSQSVSDGLDKKGEDELQMSGNGGDRPRRRRRQQTESSLTDDKDGGGEINNNNTTPVLDGRKEIAAGSERGETMAQRMQRRRQRSRASMDDSALSTTSTTTTPPAGKSENLVRRMKSRAASDDMDSEVFTDAPDSGRESTNSDRSTSTTSSRRRRSYQSTEQLAASGTNATDVTKTDAEVLSPRRRSRQSRDDLTEVGRDDVTSKPASHRRQERASSNSGATSSGADRLPPPSRMRTSVLPRDNDVTTKNISSSRRASRSPTRQSMSPDSSQRPPALNSYQPPRSRIRQVEPDNKDGGSNSNINELRRKFSQR